MSRSVRLFAVLLVLAGLSAAVLWKRRQAGWTVDEAELNETRCLVNGKGDACHQAGWLYETGENGTRQDLNRAHAAYLKGCRTLPVCCGGAARTYPGRGASVAALQGMEKLLEKGCDRKDAYSCSVLGDYSLYMMANGTNSKLHARKYFTTACDAKYAFACTKLGALLLSQPLWSTFDAQEGMTRLSSACLSGEADACRYHALGQMCGEGNRNDVEVGTKRLAGMCDEGDSRACAGLESAVYEDLIGVDVLTRPTAAVELRTRLAFRTIFMSGDEELLGELMDELDELSPPAANLLFATRAIDDGDWTAADAALDRVSAPDGGVAAEAVMLRAALNARRSHRSVSLAMGKAWRELGRPDLGESPLLADHQGWDNYRCSVSGTSPDEAFTDLRHFELLGINAPARSPMDPRLRRLLLEVTPDSPLADRLIALSDLRAHGGSLHDDEPLRQLHSALVRSLVAQSGGNGFALLLQLEGLPFLDADLFSAAEIDVLELALNGRIDVPREVVSEALVATAKLLPPDHPPSAKLTADRVFNVVGISSIAENLGWKAAAAARFASEAERRRIAGLLLKLAQVALRTKYLADVWYAGSLAEISWRLHETTEARDLKDKCQRLAADVYGTKGIIPKFGLWPSRSLVRERDAQSAFDEVGYFQSFDGADAGQ